MDPGSFVRTYKIIYLALGLGMLLFTAISFYIKRSEAFFEIPNSDDVFFVIGPATLVAGMVIGNFLYQKLSQPIRTDLPLKRRVSAYFTSNIIRFALIESPVFVLVLIFLTGGNLFYLLFTLIGLIYFITLQPKNQKMIKDLKLNYEETEEMKLN